MVDPETGEEWSFEQRMAESTVLAKIIACRFRRSSCHCLDKPAECTRPDRLIEGNPGVVRLRDCRGCLLAGSPDSPTS